MKYWRGYLTAAIFAAFTWALMRLGKGLPELVDMVYPYITRTVQTFLAQWSSGVDFCLWQLVALLLLVLLVASIVLMIVMRWNPIQWLGWVLAVVSIGYFSHTLLYGLNYYAGPLAEDVRLETSDYTLKELENATAYFRDQANKLAVRMPRDENGDLTYSDFETLAEQAADGFHTLTYQESDSIFAGSTLPVKRLGWSEMYTSMGITGVTMPLTGESAVNPDIPPVSLPFTMCHEMSHRMCIALERDANFGAFLACRANSSLEFQYSAYFMAYRYCRSGLAKAGSAASEELARIQAEESEGLKHDLASYNAFFASRKNETATKVADSVNDTYIKTSGDTQGIASYGEVCDLLVSWYLQEIVAPVQVVESTFDPFDETQVDLDYSMPPLETEEGAGE